MVDWARTAAGRLLPPEPATVSAQRTWLDSVQPVHSNHRRTRFDPPAHRRQLGASRRTCLAAEPAYCVTQRLCAHVGLHGVAKSVRTTSVRDVGMATVFGYRYGQHQPGERAYSAAPGCAESAVRGAAQRTLEQRRLLQRSRSQERVLASMA